MNTSLALLALVNLLACVLPLLVAIDHASSSTSVRAMATGLAALYVVNVMTLWTVAAQ